MLLSDEEIVFSFSWEIFLWKQKNFAECILSATEGKLFSVYHLNKLKRRWFLWMKGENFLLVEEHKIALETPLNLHWELLWFFNFPLNNEKWNENQEAIKVWKKLLKTN